MNCPVCFEMWRSDGPHRVCCTPCGHVYGRSCLEKWLHQSGKNIAKCPQCNRKFRRKEIIVLYAPQIAVPNDDLKARFLEENAPYASLSQLADMTVNPSPLPPPPVYTTFEFSSMLASLNARCADLERRQQEISSSLSRLQQIVQRHHDYHVAQGHFDDFLLPPPPPLD